MNMDHDYWSDDHHSRSTSPQSQRSYGADETGEGRLACGSTVFAPPQPETRARAAVAILSPPSDEDPGVISSLGSVMRCGGAAAAVTAVTRNVTEVTRRDAMQTDSETLQQ